MVNIDESGASGYDWSRKVKAVEATDLVLPENANAAAIELALRTANLNGRTDLLEKWKASLLGADADTIINTYEEMKSFFATTQEGTNFITELAKKVDTSKIVNDLTTGGTTSVLSAEQGKWLKDNKQDKLGYTPVQQGGGAGQAGNKIYLGWDNTQLKVQVDGSDFGGIMLKSNVVNDLTTGGTLPLTAEQGKKLQQQINTKADSGTCWLSNGEVRNYGMQNWGENNITRGPDAIGQKVVYAIQTVVRNSYVSEFKVWFANVNK